MVSANTTVDVPVPNSKIYLGFFLRIILTTLYKVGYLVPVDLVYEVYSLIICCIPGSNLFRRYLQ